MADSLWKEEYSLNIEEIDLQHKHFFEILSTIRKLLDEHAMHRDQALMKLSELADYARYHFDTEEKYFETANYDEKKDHHNQHDAFRKQIPRFVEKLLTKGGDDRDVMEDVFDFARDWLAHHILEVDKKYVKCLHEHGIN